jgi:nicotinamidase-related amidase
MVDLQRDFFQDPELERCRTDLTKACNRLVEEALTRELPVLEVRTIHAEDRSTWSLNMIDDGQGMTIAGTAGAEPIEGLHHSGTRQGISLIHKTRDSAFHGTDLAARLAEQRVDAFLLCGVSTESCIAATAIEAYAQDLSVAIVLDGTASVRWELHDYAISSLRQQYRLPCLYVEEAIASLDDRRPR